MKYFQNARFAQKETEGVTAVEIFDETDPEMAVENWEDVDSNP